MGLAVKEEFQESSKEKDSFLSNNMMFAQTRMIAIYIFVHILEFGLKQQSLNIRAYCVFEENRQRLRAC